MTNETLLKKFFPQAGEIYNSLLDERSKKNFSLRMLFNLTSDWNYIREMVSLVPEFKDKEIHPHIELCIQLGDYASENRKLIIYGAGAWGKHTVDYSLNGVKWYGFCDKNKEKQNSMFCNLPVISPEELMLNHKDAIVVIAGFKYRDEIYQDLISMGFNSNQILYFGSDPFSETYFLNDKQYFDSEIILPKENEVFVDAGCFDFHNSLVFAKWCHDSYDKIFAFEPDPSNYINCTENINKSDIVNVELINAGLWNKKDIIRFDAEGSGGSTINENGLSSVNVVSLDDVLDGQRVSFIKMDIEGAELEALKGAKESIIAHRPRLAICIYHKPEDILEIPLYLQSLVPDYKFYIRHYSNYTIETVLYAI